MKDQAKKPLRVRRAAAEKKLDEEIEELFPASDPPANTTPTSVGGPESAAGEARSKGQTGATRLIALRGRADDERPAVVAWRLVVLDHAQSLDDREPRASAHLGDQRFDARRRASNQRLDRAVGSVAHPAGDVQSQRRAAGELTISHPLHGAFDHDAADEG